MQPEHFDGQSIPWERHRVNNAANPLHLEQRPMENRNTVRYKAAWVGGANVLFDREKLLQVGGFSWWDKLPPEHAGEEVVVQFLILNRFGGCGILPASTYHLGLATNVPDRRRNATELFDTLLARAASQVLVRHRERSAVHGVRAAWEPERHIRADTTPTPAGYDASCLASVNRTTGRRPWA